MKKKNLLFTLLISTLILTIGGCSSTNSTIEQSTAEQVLERYFTALDNKDIDELQTILQHDDSMHSESGLRKFVNAIEEVELISYKVDESTLIKEERYMTSGRGTITKPMDVKIFVVEYQIKFYEDESEGAGVSGKRIWDYILIKKDKNSPWVIDDYGPSLKIQ